MTMRVASATGAPGVLPFTDARDIAAAVPRAAGQLRSARLIAYPTETVYGLGSAVDDAALGRLLALKPRASHKPFLLLIAGLPMLEQLGLVLSPPAAGLAERHWPGSLTLVVRGTRALHPAVTAPHGGVAVRWTSHPGAERVIREFGAPITSTSANAPGLPPATTVQEIVTQWGRVIAAGGLLVLDGGPLVASPPSTIVDCSGERPRLARKGIISAATLRETVPDLVGDG